MYVHNTKWKNDEQVLKQNVFFNENGILFHLQKFLPIFDLYVKSVNEI